MKKIFIVSAVMFAVCATSMAVEPKHRHNPQAVVTANAADTAEVVAYSDTTSAAAPVGNADDYDEDEAVHNGTGVVNMDISDPFSLVGYLTTIGIGGVIVAVVCVLFALLLLTSPFILIGLVFYLVAKRRNQKYKLVEKAIESGQEIPQPLLREEATSDVAMWSKGVKNMALGLGLVAFFYFIGAGALVGIGWLVFFYGAGQAVIAKTTAKKNGGAGRFGENDGTTSGDKYDGIDDNGDTKGL